MVQKRLYLLIRMDCPLGQRQARTDIKKYISDAVKKNNKEEKRWTKEKNANLKKLYKSNPIKFPQTNQTALKVMTSEIVPLSQWETFAGVIKSDLPVP